MKKILILFVILLLFSVIKTTEASVGTEKAKLIQQIQTLQKEIQRIKTLIMGLKLEREIDAKSYLVINLSDNSVLLEKNIDKPYPIASITKLMSAVIALENIDVDKTITLTKEMLEPLGYSPSLFEGLNVSVENLLKAGLIQSTNDAVNSLSYFLKKGEFLKLMNQKAKELDTDDTLFYDPHGLNLSNHSTTSDLAKLLSYIYNNHSEILSITKNNDFWLPNRTGRLLKFKNVNNFYEIPEFIGGKTGYLPEAKQTLASLFNLNEKPIAIILLNSRNRQDDTLKILDCLKSN